jgi:hypothetical protein
MKQAVIETMTSRAILGTIGVSAAALAKIHGYEIDLDLVKSYGTDVLIIVSAAVAIYGRIKAKGPIAFIKEVL